MDWVQQLLNGLALGAIYALIALGYTMVYGVLRFINFAHADVLMLGSFVAFYFSSHVTKIFGVQSIASACVIVILAALICAVIGVLIEYLAYRPLRSQARLKVLITAIGVSLFIEFTGQHPAAFGAAPQRFPDLLPKSEISFGNLHMSSNDLVVIVLTAVLLAGMWFIVQKTKLGMAMRAVSHSEKAASLMGVNVNQVVSFTFALGSALAAIAGIFYGLRFSGIDPLMGVQPGLKAFIAAVLGGIGNLPGAVLGGLLIGLIDTFAGATEGLSSYRDGIAFLILILILLFRPAGLLGKAQIEKV